MSYEEKVLSEETLFKGHVIDLAVQQVALPDGQTASREIVYHHGAVGIIPMVSYYWYDNGAHQCNVKRLKFQREKLI